jgi:hypothetical protein
MSGRNLATLEIAEEIDWAWAKGNAVKVGEASFAGETSGVEIVSGSAEKRKLNRDSRL